MPVANTNKDHTIEWLHQQGISSLSDREKAVYRIFSEFFLVI